MYVLRQGQVQILGRAFTQTGVRARPGYPHDLHFTILVIVKPKTLADGTLVRPIMTRQHFVHHGHTRRVCCIAFIEAGNQYLAKSGIKGPFTENQTFQAV